MTDTLCLEGIKAKTTIGVHAWEQAIQQTVFIDLELAVDTKKAAKQDSLEDAIDYDKLTQSVIHYLAESHCQLIETLAERLAEFIQHHFSIAWLRLSLSKPSALSSAKNVTVVIERLLK